MNNLLVLYMESDLNICVVLMSSLVLDIMVASTVRVKMYANWNMHFLFGAAAGGGGLNFFDFLYLDED